MQESGTELRALRLLLSIITELRARTRYCAQSKSTCIGNPTQITKDLNLNSRSNYPYMI